MSPASESTSLLLALTAALLAAMAAHLGGSRLAAGGALGRHGAQAIATRALGLAAGAGAGDETDHADVCAGLSTVAAQADWNAAVAGVVLALAARLLAKAVGVGLGRMGSGASWHQSVWLAGAMTPLSVVPVDRLAVCRGTRPPPALPTIARIALPAILLDGGLWAPCWSGSGAVPRGRKLAPWPPAAAHPGAPTLGCPRTEIPHEFGPFQHSARSPWA